MGAQDLTGEVQEWSNCQLSKSLGLSRATRVRIPPSPPKRQQYKPIFVFDKLTAPLDHNILDKLSQLLIWWLKQQNL